jgi:hypothetical protein
MATTEEIIKNYIERRDRIAEISKRHSEELAPLAEAQGQIENYLMSIMNQMGVDSLKANGAGTAYRATAMSCQMADAPAFKQHVFQPSINAVFNYLQAAGYALREVDYESIATAMLSMVKWDMVDFKPNKTGVKAALANSEEIPGVNVNTVATINIRRA